jgi:5-methylcytosine-specific restriction protein B
MNIINDFRAVCEFCETYPSIPGGLPSSDSRAKQVVSRLHAFRDYLGKSLSMPNGWTLKVSEGSGAFPRIPWIVLLPPGQKVSKGIYVGICFDKKGRGAVAGCMRSATHAVHLDTVERAVSGGKPALDVDGVRPQAHFNNCFNNPMEFLMDSFDPQKLLMHLQHSIVVAEKSLGNTSQYGLTDKGPLRLELGVNPFVILTGTSGSGKTRLAKRCAALLGGAARARLVPVGADWTDNRHVMGYVNHLVRHKDTERPVYQTTPIVELLLAASGDPDHPYFLILDEMNLSHVERYFADFLSKMESRDEVIFHNEDGPLKGSAGGEMPASIPCIPPNLFVIGTVNVDETTYMFSPKVLDRAQVIEFRVTPDEADAYLKTPGLGPDDAPQPDEAAAKAFLELSMRARGMAGPPLDDPPEMDKIKASLGDLFNLMHSHRLEFAYRTMNEVLRYARVDYALIEDQNDWRWTSCMDAQILQKILPKLHGNKKRMENVLVDLARFCEAGERPTGRLEPGSGLSAIPAVKRVVRPADGEKDKVAFRQSYEKLCDMLDAVRRDQYVSFIQ